MKKTKSWFKSFFLGPEDLCVYDLTAEEIAEAMKRQDKIVDPNLDYWGRMVFTVLEQPCKEEPHEHDYPKVPPELVAAQKSAHQ